MFGVPLSHGDIQFIKSTVHFFHHAVRRANQEGAVGQLRMMLEPFYYPLPCDSAGAWIGVVLRFSAQLVDGTIRVTTQGVQFFLEQAPSFGPRALVQREPMPHFTRKGPVHAADDG